MATRATIGTAVALANVVSVSAPAPGRTPGSVAAPSPPTVLPATPLHPVTPAAHSLPQTSPAAQPQPAPQPQWPLPQHRQRAVAVLPAASTPAPGQFAAAADPSRDSSPTGPLRAASVSSRSVQVVPAGVEQQRHRAPSPSLQSMQSVQVVGSPPTCCRGSFALPVAGVVPAPQAPQSQPPLALVASTPSPQQPAPRCVPSPPQPAPRCVPSPQLLGPRCVPQAPQGWAALPSPATTEPVLAEALGDKIDDLGAKLDRIHAAVTIDKQRAEAERWSPECLPPSAPPRDMLRQLSTYLVEVQSLLSAPVNGNGAGAAAGSPPLGEIRRRLAEAQRLSTRLLQAGSLPPMGLVAAPPSQHPSNDLCMLSGVSEIAAASTAEAADVSALAPTGSGTATAASPSSPMRDSPPRRCHPLVPAAAPAADVVAAAPQRTGDCISNSALWRAGQIEAQVAAATAAAASAARHLSNGSCGSGCSNGAPSAQLTPSPPRGQGGGGALSSGDGLGLGGGGLGGGQLFGRGSLTAPVHDAAGAPISPAVVAPLSPGSEADARYTYTERTPFSARVRKIGPPEIYQNSPTRSQADIVHLYKPVRLFPS